MLGKGIGIVGHERIEIGDDIWTGHYVYVTDQNHGYEDLDLPIGTQLWKNEPVSIGSGSWLGHGAVVLPGSRIGAHVVVAAGAVVAGIEVPDRSVVAGVPAPRRQALCRRIRLGDAAEVAAVISRPPVAAVRSRRRRVVRRRVLGRVVREHGDRVRRVEELDRRRSGIWPGRYALAVVDVAVLTGAVVTDFVLHRSRVRVPPHDRAVVDGAVVGPLPQLRAPRHVRPRARCRPGGTGTSLA